MNYKISTYVLLAVLAGFVVYSCGDAGKTDEANATSTATAQDAPVPPSRFCSLTISQELADSLKGQEMNRKSGGLINRVQAREDLKRLQDSIGIQCTPEDPRVIYGFTFGMDKFKEFADRVAALDKSSGNTLMGVRVFMSLKYKDMKDGSKQVYNDVFLVPLDANGNDIYDIDNCKIKELEPMGDDAVLNTSVPCPNRCE